MNQHHGTAARLAQRTPAVGATPHQPGLVLFPLALLAQPHAAERGRAPRAARLKMWSASSGSIVHRLFSGKTLLNAAKSG